MTTTEERQFNLKQHETQEKMTENHNKSRIY